MTIREPIRVLLVEDNPGDARLVREALAEAGGLFQCRHVTCLADARNQLAGNPCDVVLLDLSLPDSLGAQTIERMRAIAPALPLIVLTGNEDPDFAVSALEAGTQDFLVKSHADGEVVRRAIRYALTRKQLEDRLWLSEQRLKGIIDLAHDAIVATEENGRISLFNPAAERMFGHAAYAIVGQPLSLLVPERLRGVHERHVRTFAGGAESSRPMSDRPDIVALHANGREFPVEISISRFDSPDGLVFTAVIRDITERHRAEEELRRLATTDPLTGASNRRYFLEQAARECERAQRYDRPISMLMLDIDHFKRVNDTYGHAVGDIAIVALVDACSQELRRNDIIGRLGGEEFAILLPETAANEAVEVAERLRTRIAALPIPLIPPTANSNCFHITVSIGVAQDSIMGNRVEQMLGRADTALYQAKANGRNRVVVAQDCASA